MELLQINNNINMDNKILIVLKEDVYEKQTENKINFGGIKHYSTNEYFYNKIMFNNKFIDIYINVVERDIKDYVLILTANKNLYYIKNCMLERINNLEDFKNAVIKDLYFYKTVVVENHYNIYKNLKADIYKDIPDEELDNFDNIKVTFNGYYYIKNSMFSNYPNIFCVLPILKKLKGI